MSEEAMPLEVRAAPTGARALVEQIVVGAAGTRLWSAPRSPNRAWVEALPLPLIAVVAGDGEDDLAAACTDPPGGRAEWLGE
ncbi:MAG: hypothetical protein ACK5XM_14540 [Betaproteobacteria bacterium]